MTPLSSPVLSVVVTIVDGGDALRGLLEALASQQDAPPMEVLVAWDDTIPDAAALAARYPAVRCIPMGSVATARPSASAAGQHELFDRRRSAALPHASGELIGILEDRAWPRADWAATMVRLHRDLPHGVIGGAIAAAARDPLNWAFWAVDFGRYAPAFEAGPRQWVSDVNVCYKRRCLEATRDIWHERYNEARVHWALATRGEVLYLAPDAVVDLHTGYRSLAALLPERFHWGRLFGQVRAAEASGLGRLKLVVVAPAIPFLLFVRHAMAQRRLGNAAPFARAAGHVLAMLVAWTVGEAWGAVTGRP